LGGACLHHGRLRGRRAPHRLAAALLQLGGVPLALSPATTRASICRPIIPGPLLGLGGGPPRRRARAGARARRAEVGSEASRGGATLRLTAATAAFPRTGCAALPGGEQRAGCLAFGGANARSRGSALRRAPLLCRSIGAVK
jgi:hypothetical protein